MAMNLSRRVRFEPGLDSGSGTATRTGPTIDVRGYDAIAFVVQFGAVAAGASHDVRVQGGKLADGSDMADLAGTKLAITDVDDNSIQVVDIGHPRFRYLRLIVTKDAANASTEAAVAQLYNSGAEPVQQPTWTVSKHVHAPDQGTA